MIDVTKLEKRRDHSGYIKAQCPACFEAGHDKKGDHLIVWPTGAFGCALCPGDKQHTHRIWELVMGATPQPTAPIFRRPEPSINCRAILKRWSDANLSDLAVMLNLPVAPLAMLGATWAPEYNAWAFPMSDGYRNIVGIRLRSAAGRKWAVRGSRQGLFIPAAEPQEMVYLTEGPTDCAAVLSLGLYAIGRPSCNGCVQDTKLLLKRIDTRRVVILADNDAPGLAGAHQIMREMPVPCNLLIPPCKDIREFVSMGGTKALLESMVKGMKWFMPK